MKIFLKNNKALTFLKLRGSYGLVGNDEIGGTRFLFEQRYPFGAQYFFGTGTAGSNSISEGRLAYQDVSWEKDKNKHWP